MTKKPELKPLPNCWSMTDWDGYAHTVKEGTPLEAGRKHRPTCRALCGTAVPIALLRLPGMNPCDKCCTALAELIAADLGLRPSTVD